MTSCDIVVDRWHPSRTWFWWMAQRNVPRNVIPFQTVYADVYVEEKAPRNALKKYAEQKAPRNEKKKKRGAFWGTERSTQRNTCLEGSRRTFHDAKSLTWSGTWHCVEGPNRPAVQYALGLSGDDKWFHVVPDTGQGCWEKVWPSLISGWDVTLLSWHLLGVLVWGHFLQKIFMQEKSFSWFCEPEESVEMSQKNKLTRLCSGSCDNVNSDTL